MHQGGEPGTQPPVFPCRNLHKVKHAFTVGNEGHFSSALVILYYKPYASHFACSQLLRSRRLLKDVGKSSQLYSWGLVFCISHTNPVAVQNWFQCPLWVSEQSTLLQTKGLPLCHCYCYFTPSGLSEQLQLCSPALGKTKMCCGKRDSPMDTNTHQAASAWKWKCNVCKDWTSFMRLALLVQWGFILSKNWSISLQNIKFITLFNDVLLSYVSLQV